MIKKLFTIYDQAAQTYQAPWSEVATGSAIRAFTDAANDPKSAINQHAADYTLFELGTYDTDNAEFKLLEVPTNLGCAINFKES